MHLVKSVREKLLGSNVTIFHYDQEFTLEGGASLRGLKIAYTTYGKLSAAKDNVVWVFHALTANADPFEWWPGLVGKDDLINPEDHYIVCANMLGSCYGTTGPDHDDPETGQKYGLDFPTVTIKDMVKAHRLLKDHLGIDKIYLGIGGSMGGQQLLQWAVEENDLFENLCAIATNARHSAWGIAFNAAQRMAMEADPTLNERYEGAGENGLKAARAIAMLSYRNQNTYRKTQTDFEDKIDDFKASSYQYYQGEKLVRRFTSHAYWYLSKAMDSHNVGRGFSSVPNALRSIKSKSLVIGLRSDMLFPIAEQRFVAKNMKNASFEMVESLYGHDGFLIEAKVIGKHLKEFLNSKQGDE